MLQRMAILSAMSLSLLAGQAHATAPGPDGVVRIPIECEDMQGVKWDSEGKGFTPAWTAGRWGYDLHQNMIFGGCWSSRYYNAVTDASDAPSEATHDIEITQGGKYKVWAKYECVPFFNYPFGIRVQPIGADGKTGAAVLDKTYGLRSSPKHFSFTDKLTTGDLFWSWGIDHDAAEGYEADLQPGKYRVTLYKAGTSGPDAGGPVGARSVDAILITSKISTLSNGDAKEDFNRFPLIDEIQKANRFFVRFKNTGPAPIVVTYNHWNHHANHYYNLDPRLTPLVRFYDAAGKQINDDKGAPLAHPLGQWIKPIEPGQTSPWIDIGPTMTTENSCPMFVRAGTATEPGKFVEGTPVGMDLATEPSDAAIFKSLATEAGEPQLDVLIQPDFHRKEGKETTAKTVDVFRRATAVLEQFPRVGPIPKKLRLYGHIGVAYWGPKFTADRPDFGPTMDYAIALGLNTVPIHDAAEVELIDAAQAYYAKKGAGFVPLSAKYHHTQDVEVMKKQFSDPKVRERFYYVSFGDEIGLPRVDVTDQKLLADFHAFLKARGIKPEDLGAKSYDTIKPLTAYSADVAVQIGVLPTPGSGQTAKMPEGEAGKHIKRLYWWSSQFAVEQGIQKFANTTKAMTEIMGPQFKTSANLGGMHPFYWMHQSSFIESFKHGAMTLAWSEDYDYCQPEATRLVADFQTAYLRAGAKYHDTPMMFYCMPHWPGNTGQHLVQNAVLEWGQGVQDLDFFNTSIDAYGTENYLHSRGGHAETGRGIRLISGMAGNIEDALIPARTKQAKVAILLSEASDVWELDGSHQGAVVPGAKISNASQEERKNTWYALRNAGYLVDLLTENDVAEGRLEPYLALYVCGHNLDRRAVKPIKNWVEKGGRLMLTAGAARFDQYDEPLTDLDELAGRGATDDKSVFYGGPLRAKMELLQIEALDRVEMGGRQGQSWAYDVFATREVFAKGKGAEVLGSYKDGGPAVIRRKANKGVVFTTGTLPGQAYVRHGLMPARPMGKGGPEWNFSQIEPMEFDDLAAKVILLPVEGLTPEAKADHRGVVTNVLESKTATLIPVVNLAKLADGKLKDVTIAVPGLRGAKNVRTAMKQKASVQGRGDQTTIELRELDEADVIVIEH